MPDGRVLDPNERASFLEMLRPPPGYDLAAGVGTAYSLQPDVLTAALLALIGADAGEEATPDPATTVRAIRRLGSRLRVVVNRGGIAADSGRAPARLIALFDRIIRDIALPGAFHPKVWVLKFVARRRPELRDGVPLYRVVCASRNVTDSRAWELAVRLEGIEEPRATTVGRSLAAFCRRVLEIGRTVPPALASLPGEIERVRFEESRESGEELDFLWQWPGSPGLIAHVPRTGRRAVFVAPFLGARLVRNLGDRFGELWLVSTQRELDALDAGCLGPPTAGRVFVVGNGEGAGTAGFDLHAKILLTESGEGTRTYLGSANGTSAAWGLDRASNCEALVMLSPGIGIDRFLRTFVRRSDGAPHPWVEPYRRTQPETPDDVEQTLDRLEQATAKLTIEARYDRPVRRLTLRVSTSIPGRLLADARFAIEVAPLLLREREGAFRPLDALVANEIIYEPVEIADLSDFLIVRVADRHARLAERTFIVLAHSDFAEEVREARDDALCADLLRNADARALLWTILWGPGSVPGDSGGSGAGAGGGGRAGRGDVLGEVTIEGVMEACTEDPGRIGEIDSLLRVLGDRDTLGPAFRAFWGVFKRAHASVAGDEGVA